MGDTSASKPNKPSNSAFKQQRLKGWRCSPSTLTQAFVYLLIFAGFVTFGILILVESHKVKEYSKRYDDIDDCKANWRTPRTCVISLHVEERMESPVFFYFEIKNMFQNHRRYNKSRDIRQLMGDVRSKSDIRKYCDPVVDMDDLGFYTTLNLTEDDPANPCGLVAKSYFNDTYLMLTPENEQVPMSSDGIAWRIDVDEKFKRSDDSEKLQWIDVENEHFIVWMSTAGLPQFRKLWGRIDQDLPEGEYNIVIVNNYDVSSFSGQKTIILSTTSFFGGKNAFLGVLYVIVAGFALVGSCIMFASHYLIKNQRPAH